MNRVQVLGYSGSGKSTLAKRFAKKSDCKYVELDSLFWLENWKEKPTPEFKREVEQALKGDGWVSCGAYIDRLKGYALNRTDTVIILEYSFLRILYRLLKRSFSRAVKKEKLWGNNEERFMKLFRPSESIIFFFVKHYRKGGRFYYYKKIMKYEYGGRVLRFRTPREAEEWLTKA